MQLDEFATSILLTLSSLLGVGALPSSPNGDWQVIGEPWREVSPGFELAAESSAVPQKCREMPKAFVRFPLVVHGSHAIKTDNHLVATFGEQSFASVRSFYGVPEVSCEQLRQAKEVQWTVRSYTKYFARIGSFPTVVAHRPNDNVIQETLNAVAAGTLLLMTLVTTLLFAGRVPWFLVLSVAAANFFFSAYFGAAVAQLFGIQGSMLQLHKIGDSGLWLASLFLLNAFHLQGLFGRRYLLAHFAAVACALCIIATAETGDAVQLGTMVPFGSFFGAMLAATVRLFAQMKNKSSRKRCILALLSLSSFVLSAINDFLIVSGVYEGSTLLSAGMVAGTLLLALDVNERIADTYHERDYLRKNLEKEVQIKTARLTIQAGELESALQQVKATQSELIQAAKMASLGTLSAGIAHEINNSLNYVNGALAPLQMVLSRATPFPGHEKAAKLLKVMEQGLTVTFDIIKSLRTYSGLNIAKLKDLRVADLVQSVLTILRSRIPESVSVQVEVSPDLEVRANGAGLNQVIMNLVTNAIDAIPETGRVVIAAKEQDDLIEISVSDTGTGMSEQTAGRIFEPFFTTKDVGKGSGLGLHICRSEVERHGGTIRVSSEIGRGTTFVVALPKAGPALEKLEKVA